MLTGRERLQHVLPDRLDADALDEAPDDLEVDVRFEQRHANLAQRFDDGLLRQPAVPPEPVEDTCETRREIVEHDIRTRSGILGTLKDIRAAGKSQAYFTTSEALRRSLTA